MLEAFDSVFVCVGIYSRVLIILIYSILQCSTDTRRVCGELELYSIQVG
jgi:hypothetical protein